ncbi:Rv1733c family protein [Streptomyces sp. UG1]|uniref:Rv1733c family protein n=1 Tax=Streptomyces sp. UG1 TaxID=3417652 RepID=UPI003CF95E06
MTRPGRLCWRLRRNPLRRRSYLTEAWLILLAWTSAVLVAVVTGVLTAHAVERDMNGLRAQRHPVTAVLTEDAETSTSATEGADSARVWAKVRWAAADGTSGTGLARVEPGRKAGETTRVWLNDKGRLVPAPPTRDQAELQGAVLGTAAAVGVGALPVLAGWAAIAHLERQRLRQWETEWAEVGPRWRRKAG